MKHSLERTSPTGPGQQFIGTAIEGPEDAKRVDAVALALLQATCRYYGDPIPENPDLSLTRVLARAALDAISSLIPERVPGPFIAGRGGEERDGLPEQLHVCPTYGADWSAVYQRLPAADAY